MAVIEFRRKFFSFKFLWVFLSFFLLLNGLWFYGFVGDGLWALLVLLFIVLYRRTGWRNFTMVAVSFSIVTLFFLWLVPRLGWEDRLYPDAHSRMETRGPDGRAIYRPNARLEMEQPFGDLKRMAAPDLELDLEPRHIVFQSDSLGFRNDRDYAGQRWVLAGDSFIAGNGNSQESLLDQQLRRRGVDSYNLGWPGALPDYVANIQRLRDRYGERFKVLLFVFEGNDFLETERIRDPAWARVKSLWKHWSGVYRNFFRDTGLYRLTRMVYASARQRFSGNKQVAVHRLDSKRVGFYQRYLDIMQRQHYRLPVWVEQELSRVRHLIHHVFFIPVKYRVLQPLLDPHPPSPLPHAQWEALRSTAGRLGLPLTDLTPHLIRANKRLWKTGKKLVFWTDDTHWNPLGMEAAASALCATLPELACDSPARPG